MLPTLKNWIALSCLVGMVFLPGAFANEKMASLFPDAASIHPDMQAEDYQEYEDESLFDYINGGAEIYLGLGFLKVGAREYFLTLEDEVYFTLDIYDMAKPLQAFGIFSQERYSDTPAVPVGVEGRLGGGSLTFHSQRYYVKIRADDEGEAVDKILMKMATLLEKKIGAPGEAPELLALFPEQKEHKGLEKYQSQGLLGRAFLKGFSCSYGKGKEAITLYLNSYENDKESQKAEKALLESIKKTPVPDPDGGGFCFDDRYMGKGRFMRIGVYLAMARQPKNPVKADSWQEETTRAFFEKVAEAGLKKKTDNALKAMLGGAEGDD